MTVLAHAGHWLADALYVAPLFVVAALLVAGRRRERRRTRRRQVNGQTPGSGG